MKTENQLSKIKPADRLASVSEYYFSKKLKEVAQMNAEGKDVISLGIGSPDMPPSESTIQTLCDAARNPDGHGYQPYVGIPELRRSFAGWYKKWYGVELDPNTEIQPLIGSKEGILHVTLAFVNPGEHPFMRCRDWVSVVRLCVSSILPDVRCGWGIRMPMRRIVASAWLRLTCSVWWISVRWCPSMIRMPSIRSVWGVWGVLPNLWRCVISPVE